MPRCPNGTRKNKQGDCVGTRKPTKSQKTKKHCVRNANTRRCVKSVSPNETSSECKFVNKTQTCRVVKRESFVDYKGYKVSKGVKSYLEKKIENAPLKKLIDAASKDEDYEDTLQFVFEDKMKSEAQIKQEFIDEILELAMNHARDSKDTEVIGSASLKHVFKSNAGFQFMLKL
jgi:hypothetical protein